MHPFVGHIVGRHVGGNRVARRAVKRLFFGFVGEAARFLDLGDKRVAFQQRHSRADVVVAGLHRHAPDVETEFFQSLLSGLTVADFVPEVARGVGEEFLLHSFGRLP